MDYFLTTYNKDFKWPMVSEKKVDDTTKIEEATGLAKKKYTEILENEIKTKELEAEITPAQVGATPTGPSSQFDQPNTYLQKLYTKYPYLYEIMKITPPAELAKKVYMEKYKTTYQEDFTSKGFIGFQDTLESLAGHAEKLEAPGICSDDVEDEGQPAQKRKKCACDHDTKYYPCTCAQDALPVVKRAWKPAPISKMIRVPRDKESKSKTDDKQKEKEKGVQAYYKPYSTEYKDTIGKTGKTIINKKLLYYQPEET